MTKNVLTNRTHPASQSSSDIVFANFLYIRGAGDAASRHQHADQNASTNERPDVHRCKL